MECYWQSTTDRWKLKWPLGVNKSKSSEFGSIKGREGGGGESAFMWEPTSIGHSGPCGLSAFLPGELTLGQSSTRTSPLPGQEEKSILSSPTWLTQYFSGSQNKISTGLLFLVSSSMTPVSIISKEREMFSGHLWVSGGLGWERSA